MRLAPFLSLALALSAPADGQTYQPAGFFYGCSATQWFLGSMQPNTSWEVVLRIPDAEIRDWGVSFDRRDRHDVHGLQIALGDINLATNESYSLKGYNQRAGTPLPDLGRNILNAGPIAMPPGGGFVRFVFNIVFTTPLAGAVLGEDTFLGCELHSRGPRINDGILIAAVLNVPPGFNSGFHGICDAPGAGLPMFAPGYAVSWFSGQQPQGAGQGAMPWVDPFLDETSGVCVAVTNQPLHPASNTPPGAAGFLSGMHPDAKSPPLHRAINQNPARADNPGFRVHDADLAGDPIVFFVSARFGPSFYLAPGNEGTFCADLSSLVFMGVALGSPPTSQPYEGEAWVVVDLGPPGSPVRATLGGLSLVWNAIGFDGRSLRGSPCVKQSF